jgi:conjugal transfer pilus assembly protein TraW
VSFKIFLATLVCFYVLSGVAANATLHDLGRAGETYPVVEPDIVAELKERALHNQPTREEMVQKIKHYQPHNLKQLPAATENRTFLVDMTYTLTTDLFDRDGRLLYPKGYTFNPLDYVSFPGGMVVLDGANSKQLNWFKESPYYENHRAKLLISGGYAYELVQKLKRPVFYLTQKVAERLHLAAVPSVVVQQGKNLQVSEVYVPPIQKGHGDE